MKLTEKFSKILSLYDAFLNGKLSPEISRLHWLNEQLPIAAASVWLKVKTGIILEEVDYTIVHKIQHEWSKETENVFNEAADIYTSNLAIYYITLSEVKNEYQLFELQKEITEIRDFIFAHMIRQGSLISSLKKKIPAVDLVFSVLPFGLFAPEDLVMVSGIQELVSSQSESLSVSETALLGIYYTEKYDFGKADMYLSMAATILDDDECILLSLLETYLRQKKESISANAFIHKPLGNGNVYDTLPYERAPHYPTAGGTCKFNVQVNSQTVEKVFMKLDGIAERIPCLLVDEALHIYQAVVELPEEYVEGSYSFIAIGEEIETSVDYELTIKEQVIVRKVDFIGSTSHENIYQAVTNHQTIFLNLQKTKLQMSLNKPAIKSNKLNEQCLIIDSTGAITTTDGQVIVTFFEDMLEIQELIGKGIFSISLKFFDDAEIYYGFGERYNAINQFGTIIDCFVYNQYRDQGTRTYMPMPYYFTDKGYGLSIVTDYYTRFDLQHSNKGIVELTVETEPTDFIFEIDLLHGSMKEMIQQYIQSTGQPRMVPSWVFGPWMSSNNWDRDSVVREQIKLTNEHGIPSTVIVLEQWSDETTYYMFNDAQYSLLDPGKSHSYDQMTFPEWGRWPDPKGLIEHCHENGLKFILWQIPIGKYLNQQKHPLKDQDEKFMIEQGYVVKNSDGTPYRIPENWFTDSLLLDFTNKAAKKWWFEKRQYLIELGVDGFKTDGGEMVYGADVQFSDGSNGRKMRNNYPKEYIKSYYEFAQQNQGITFSRAGYTGAQTYPAHWAGDERSTFDAFKRQLIAGINSGLSGVIFWGWDLGGFNGDIPTAELFMRSASMAAFCPIMQYHAESKGEFNQDRTPWNIADRTNTPEVIDVYRFFANTRMNLLPYIYDQSQKAVNNCLPLMRALKIEYPSEAFDNCYDQFMFGESLLIAPVIREGEQSRFIQFPEGTWTDFWTHQVVEGGQTIEVHAKANQIPVFIKQNSIVLLNLGNSGIIGEQIGNDIKRYTRPKLIVTAKDDFKEIIEDHLGNSINVTVDKAEKSIMYDSNLEIEIEFIDL